MPPKLFIAVADNNFLMYSFAQQGASLESNLELCALGTRPSSTPCHQNTTGGTASILPCRCRGVLRRQRREHGP